MKAWGSVASALAAPMTRKWDLRFLHLAQYIAEWSRDPSTKTGAVIVDEDKRIVDLVPWTELSWTEAPA